ncbi:MAG TPA: transcription antitermination factor NusB [Polyangia bacterium]|jgi:transcription antitermination protein NusB|nr:transcription antitermination factor NusB [Polyangia bacterium]
MAGPRRRSREIALQILHQMDVGGDPDTDVSRLIAHYFEHLAPSGAPAADDDDELAGPAPAIDRALIEELVRGVSDHHAELDELLTGLSRNWRVERMGIVERNVIRIALYELKYAENVPVAVILNEAVELAKRYGAAEGGAFVNGLLDRAAAELPNRR